MSRLLVAGSEPQLLLRTPSATACHRQPTHLGADRHLDPPSFLSGGFPEPSSFVDPLAQDDACARDVPYLKELGVNAVRPSERARLLGVRSAG